MIKGTIYCPSNEEIKLNTVMDSGTNIVSVCPPSRRNEEGYYI